MAEICIIPLPKNINSIIGSRFSRLTVIGYGGKLGRAHKWVCLCDCGVTTLKRSDHMSSGRSRSCGCVNLESQKSNFEKHGGAVADKATRHHLYSTWCGMKKRCYSERCDAYPYYGGRGIGVCDEWRHDFSAFARDMGKKPDGMTLDRIDSDGDYSAGNCKWSTKSEQMKNRRPFRRLNAKQSEYISHTC
jgi:hypothetical protein